MVVDDAAVAARLASGVGCNHSNCNSGERLRRRRSLHELNDVAPGVLTHTCHHEVVRVPVDGAQP